MKTNPPYKSAFTLVEIMIVVAIIGLLAAVAIPNFVNARLKTQRNVCILNLQGIEGAKNQWALESKAPQTATPQLCEIQPYLGRGKLGTAPACPADPTAKFESSYSINNLDTAPACLIMPGTPGDTGGHRLE